MRNLLGQSESILPCENGQCLSFVQSSALVDRRRAVVAEDRNAARRPVGGSGHVARRPESWFGRAVYAVYAISSLDLTGHSKIPSVSPPDTPRSPQDGGVERRRGQAPLYALYARSSLDVATSSLRAV